MANNKKAETTAPKKVFYTQKGEDGKQIAKYEVLGKRFLYQGDAYTAEKAVKNKELMENLIENKAPSIKKV